MLLESLLEYLDSCIFTTSLLTSSVFSDTVWSEMSRSLRASLIYSLCAIVLTSIYQSTGFFLLVLKVSFASGVERECTMGWGQLKGAQRNFGTLSLILFTSKYFRWKFILVPYFNRIHIFQIDLSRRKSTYFDFLR